MTEPVPAWPVGAPRVLVTDCWLPNAGDAAVALAVDRMIRRIRPDASILHAAYGGELVADRYPSLTIVPPLDALLGVAGASSLPDSWNARDAATLADGADLVLSQGGGFLLERYQPWRRLLALEQVAARGRPVAFVAQSIGWFGSAAARRVLGALLRSAVVVTVRDVASRLVVSELGRPMPADAVTGDLTLTLDPPKRLGADDAAGSSVVVVLTADAQAADGVDGALRRALADVILLETLTASGPSTGLRILSTAQGLADEGFEDDSQTARSARAALPAEVRERVEVVEGYVSADDAWARLASAPAVVSQRLHAALFALMAGVPAALLVERAKCGVLDGADLGGLVCPTPVDDRARRAAIERALDPTVPRGGELQQRLERLRARAAVNEAFVREALDRIG